MALKEIVDSVGGVARELVRGPDESPAVRVSREERVRTLARHLRRPRESLDVVCAVGELEEAWGDPAALALLRERVGKQDNPLAVRIIALAPEGYKPKGDFFSTVNSMRTPDASQGWVELVIVEDAKPSSIHYKVFDGGRKGIWVEEERRDGTSTSWELPHTDVRAVSYPAVFENRWQRLDGRLQDNDNDPRLTYVSTLFTPSQATL